MRFDTERLTKDIEILRNQTELYRHPRWSDLPGIDLYMDQVVVLLNQYLGIFSLLSANKNPPVTATMINNYVKLGTIPAPVKKKYSRRHLAFLIIVCTLKQTHSIATIQRMLPTGTPEAELEKSFDEFAAWQESALKIMVKGIPSASSGDEDEAALKKLLIQSAIEANLLTALTDNFADHTTAPAVPSAKPKKADKDKKTDKTKKSDKEKKKDKNEK